MALMAAMSGTATGFIIRILQSTAALTIPGRSAVIIAWATLQRGGRTMLLSGTSLGPPDVRIQHTASLPPKAPERGGGLG